ncbi:MAG: coat protein [Ruminococcaceae bacterium]|nr:coat protein [Oscillospiraceae bacterium]
MSTYLNFPFDEEIFVQSWDAAPDATKTAMIDSGALVEDAMIASRIQAEGGLYTIPFYSVLEGEPDNYDGATDISSSELAGGSQTGVVYGRGKGFTARNFASELSSADPMGHIATTIGKYWAKQRQKALLSILGAIFGITGSAGNAKKWKENHTVDLTSATATPYTIGATDLNDLATLAMGDNKNLFSLAIMHSNVAKTLENLQMLEYWKYTDANGVQRPTALASVNGFTVVIDDGVPVQAVGGSDANQELTTYTTYLLGEGAIRTARGRVDVPAEIYRDPAKNGGQDTLYTRIRETIHPNGFSFTAPSTGWTNSPTDAQLANAANWSVAFDPKAIPIARLLTNG